MLYDLYWRCVTWISDSATEYIVRGAYHTLTCGTPPNITDVLVSADLLWRKDVPLKVSVFVWRLFRNWLPMKLNLFHRELFRMRLDFGLAVTGCTNPTLICSWIATCLVRYGTLFSIGWVFNPRFHLS